MAGVIKNVVYRSQLLTFLGLNIAVCWLTFTGRDILAGDWTTIAKDWAAALPPSLGLLAIGAISGLVSQTWKARLVFLRWSHPLPGSRAFTRHIHQDTRIDAARLEKKHGPFPAEPAAQNGLWYRLYKTVADRPEVSHVHRDFLINRDLATLSVLSFVVAVPIAWFMAPAPGTTLTLAAIFAVEYLVFRQAAANYGVRMATTVLAIKSAQR